MSYQNPPFRAFGIVLALIVCATGALSVPVQADRGNNGHNYNGNDHRDSRGKHDRPVAIINDNDRSSIRSYVESRHHRHCPPGLAKKHNGCMPPGQIRRYEVGKKLPSNVTYVAVPYAASRNWRQPQPGYQYVLVDNDVLLVSKTDRTIADAVALISDLAR